MKALQPALVTMGVALCVAGCVLVVDASTPQGSVPPGAVHAALVVVVLNGLGWALSAYLRTERFFDLVGSASFLASLGAWIWVGALSGSWRSSIVLFFVSVWAVRLGVFLFSRVRQDGSDARFDEVRHRPMRFLVFWVLQILWVVVTLMPVSSLLQAGGGPQNLHWVDAAGGALVLGGLTLEVVADEQKRRFRRAGGDGFISSGVWSWSQHPNYFGEIVFWVGITTLCSAAFVGLSWFSAMSPVFVAVLLTRISGIPLLDARAEARWGGDAEWLEYRRRTPKLVPRFPRG